MRYEGGNLTRLFPSVPRSPTDLVLTLESETRMDQLAFEYYGDAKLWWIIAGANDFSEANFVLSSGVQVRIPQDISAVLSRIEKVNRTR